MKVHVTVVLCSLLAVVEPALAQDSTASKTFLTKKDLAYAGLALGGTLALSYFDDDIARASQKPRFQDSSLHRLALNISHVNETTLTLAGIASYGVARLFHSATATDITLHATEAVVLASVASQLIRGPLGRTRPYVTHDSDQYRFKAFAGFVNDTSFNYRAFPSIHTSSSIAVATVLSMELHRRKPGAAKFVAPVLFAAALLPGLARIQLDQHWASDVAAGAFMGVFSGYKVVSYSHAHPDNWFDRTLLSASLLPDEHGRMKLEYNHAF
ncbi:MAG: phosphoesterase PA-phosphatase related protein [Gemmatimonadetes bacterium]|nr:phosphoesterase PA-phosphatase related protein [Gemmatimonadota bacterium]